jgi:tRNA threonylcarbamoyl adenosine modification protein TsaD
VIILGIETSCDETAAAVVRDGKEILSSTIASQVSIHGPYGGVVPELASRKHLEYIIPVIESALEKAGVSGEQLDALAVTQGPGLVGALLVGLSAAKAMAYALNKPLIAVNHLEGHIQAAFLSVSVPKNPFVCLVVSGGHTALYRVDDCVGSSLLGATRDDAAGEAFDKIAKLLGIGYPGGIAIDKLAAGANPGSIHFPRSRFEKESLEFSFSGLKTAAANFIRAHGPPLSISTPLGTLSALDHRKTRHAAGAGLARDETGRAHRVGTAAKDPPFPKGGKGDSERLPAGRPASRGPRPATPEYTLQDFAASFQEAIVDVLVEKTIKAAKQCGLSEIAAVGGVAANSRLRARLSQEAASEGFRLYLPPVQFCTDNAVMIASAAHRIWMRSGPQDGMFDLDAYSR